MTIATMPPVNDEAIVVQVAFAANLHLLPVTPKVLKIRQIALLTMKPLKDVKRH